MTQPSHIVPARSENDPISNVSSNCQGSGKTGRAAMLLLLDESPLMIVMPDNGEVFALDPCELRAQAITNLHSEWIVGTYTDRCGTGTIAGDLRVRARELGRAAA